ncbi:SH3 domain-containing protein [Bacillus sp. 1P10SD]|uniref:SH3 domain-containing protein n=1 Tax=Bacillus sp. 1P10SD TaxID=3132265 RepID=UPI0039A711B0
MIDKIQTSFMEYIYRFYIKLMGMAAPYRMVILIAIIGFLSPLILKVLIFLFRKSVSGVTALLNSSQQKLGEIIFRRRNKGKNPFFGTGLLDALLSFFLLIFTKLNNFLTKKRNFHPKTKKRYVLSVGICALLFPIWGTVNPESVVGNSWSKFEVNLINQHLVKLGFNPNNYKSFASFSAELAAKFEEETTEASSPQQNSAYITPANNAKNGVYIRTAPDGSSSSLDVLAFGDKAVFLGETSVSTSGITWYKIQTNSKVTGWVSSKVTIQTQ